MDFWLPVAPALLHCIVQTRHHTHRVAVKRNHWQLPNLTQPREIGIGISEMVDFILEFLRCASNWQQQNVCFWIQLSNETNDNDVQKP